MVQQVFCLRLSRLYGISDFRAQDDCILHSPTPTPMYLQLVLGSWILFLVPTISHVPDLRKKTANKQSWSFPIRPTPTRLDQRNAKPPNPSYCVCTCTVRTDIAHNSTSSFSRDQHSRLRLEIRRLSEIDMFCSRSSGLAEIKEPDSSPGASRAAARWPPISWGSRLQFVVGTNSYL